MPPNPPGVPNVPRARPPRRLIPLAGLLALGAALAGGAGGPDRGALLGGPLNAADAPGQFTAATTDPQGHPVIAWVERDGTGDAAVDHLRAARWTGRAWQALGGVMNDDARHNAFRLYAGRGPDGQPWFSWAEDAGLAHVDSTVISGWDGERWSSPARYALRRNLSDAGKSSGFAVGADNVPVLLWTNVYYPGAAADVVQPFTWKGDHWDQGEQPLNTTLQNSAYYPATSVTPDGTQIGVWLEGRLGRYDVRVAAKRPGGAWSRLGGPLNVRPNTYTFAPRIEVDARGRPVVAWLEDQGGIDTLFVKRWDGARWVPLGGALNIQSRAMADRPALALDAQGRPLVVWAEGEGLLYAKRWTGAEWALLGGGPLNVIARRPAAWPGVTVNQQGEAFVVWREGSSDDARVYVKRFSVQ